jgi:hypothetical protein
MDNKMEIVIDVCECSGDEEYLAVSGDVLVCQSCGQSQSRYSDCYSECEVVCECVVYRVG